MVKICIIPFLIGLVGAILHYANDYFDNNQSTIIEEVQNVREK